MEKALNTFFGNRWYYHTAFWLSYNGFWHIMFSDEMFTLPSLILSSCYLICHLSASYLNIYWLIPTFLDRKRYGIYGLLLALDCLVFSALLGLLMAGYLHLVYGPETAAQLTSNPTNFLGSVVGSTCTTVLLVMAIKTSKQKLWLNTKAKATEKERLEAELKFLKAQLNPHFLFNAINNIYFLIRRDPEAAENALSKFSEMLRYQLYECNDDKIPLQKELHYLQSYINLSALSKNRLEVNFEADNQINGQMIAPIVLIPLVENAFKHVSNHRDKPNWIDIRLQLEPGNLSCRIANSKMPGEEQTEPKPPGGGIGLDNVRRRLALIYPGQHQLDLRETNDSFSVSLTLPI